MLKKLQAFAMQWLEKKNTVERILVIKAFLNQSWNVLIYVRLVFPIDCFYTFLTMNNTH